MRPSTLLLQLLALACLAACALAVQQTPGCASSLSPAVRREPRVRRNLVPAHVIESAPEEPDHELEPMPTGDIFGPAGHPAPTHAAPSPYMYRPVLEDGYMPEQRWRRSWSRARIEDGWVPIGPPASSPEAVEADLAPAVPSFHVRNNQLAAPGAACGSGKKGVCIAQSACGLPRYIQFGQCQGSSYCCMPPAGTSTPTPAPAQTPTGKPCGTGSKGQCIPKSACGAPRTIMYGQCPGADYCCMPASTPAPVPAPASAPAQPTGMPCGTGSKGVCIPQASCGAPRTIMYGQCPGADYCCMPVGSMSTTASSRPSPMRDLRGTYSPGAADTTRTFVWADFTEAQKSNIQLLVKYAKMQGLQNTPADINAMAYVLGTCAWEALLTPIKEYGGAGKSYAPYFGRGFVQLTHRMNYQKFNAIIKAGLGRTVDLVANPDAALDATNAAYIAIYGFIKGTFTGVKLSDYFKDASNPRWVAARAIINGSDKAEMIANISKAFRTLTAQLMASPTNSPA